MAGAGFSNDVMYASNVDFSGGKSATVTTDGQLLIGSTVSPNIRVGNLASADGSIQITNGSGTINLKGISSANDLHVAKWIVNQSVNSGGNQTTIQSAINNAVSGETIFIFPGTYTENLTLKAGVNLTAFGCDSSQNATGHVIINGTCTLTTAGTVTISGIQLQTNSAALLAVTGSAASIVNLQNCYLNCTNSTGITFSSSNAGAQINIDYCKGNLGTTGISYFSDSSAGTLNINYSDLDNTGASVTASTKSAGILTARFSSLRYVFTYSSSNTTSSYLFCNASTNAINTTAVTTSGTGTFTIDGGRVDSGTASAISAGAGTTVACRNCVIFSSNTNAITGAGQLTYQTLSFSSTSNTINTTTQIGGTIQGGKTQAPSAGFIGEQISNSATGISLSNSTPANITSINLTAGIWDISGIASHSFTGNSTVTQVGISATSATITGSLGINYSQLNIVESAAVFTSSVPNIRVVLTSTTTYYLVANQLFSSGTCTGTGRISATRVG